MRASFATTSERAHACLRSPPAVLAMHPGCAALVFALVGRRAGALRLIPDGVDVPWHVRLTPADRRELTVCSLP